MRPESLTLPYLVGIPTQERNEWAGICFLTTVRSAFCESSPPPPVVPCLPIGGPMNHLRIAAFAILFCTSFAWITRAKSAAAHPSVDSKSLSPLEQQLISFEKAIPEAQKKHDIDFYKHTLTDDFVAVGTDAKLHAKDEILEDLRSADLVEYRPYDIQVVQLNDGAAVVTYDVIIEMSRYDEDIPRYQHISSIWVKQGDQWKLRFQQATAAQ